MKYRDARLLKAGDQVTRKSDNQQFVIDNVELYGQFKTVKIICTSVYGVKETLYNEEIK